MLYVNAKKVSIGTSDHLDLLDDIQNMRRRGSGFNLDLCHLRGMETSGQCQ